MLVMTTQRNIQPGGDWNPSTVWVRSVYNMNATCDVCALDVLIPLFPWPRYGPECEDVIMLMLLEYNVLRACALRERDAKRDVWPWRCVRWLLNVFGHHLSKKGEREREKMISREKERKRERVIERREWLGSIRWKEWKISRCNFYPLSTFFGMAKIVLQKNGRNIGNAIAREERWAHRSRVQQQQKINRVRHRHRFG